jgi:hypothetical protein
MGFQSGQMSADEAQHGGQQDVEGIGIWNHGGEMDELDKSSIYRRIK